MCENAKHERRIRCPERLELVAGEHSLLVDVEVLQGMKEDGRIHGHKCPAQMTLEVTNLRPEEAATRIFEHIQLLASAYI